MRIQITEFQVAFIKKAIDLKEAVIPFEITEEEFKEEYGITKVQAKESISALSEKLKTGNNFDEHGFCKTCGAVNSF